jgi:hypothetical protein
VLKLIAFLSTSFRSSVIWAAVSHGQTTLPVAPPRPSCGGSLGIAAMGALRNVSGPCSNAPVGQQDSACRLANPPVDCGARCLAYVRIYCLVSGLARQANRLSQQEVDGKVAGESVIVLDIADEAAI